MPGPCPPSLPLSLSVQQATRWSSAGRRREETEPKPGGQGPAPSPLGFGQREQPPFPAACPEVTRGGWPCSSVRAAGGGDGDRREISTWGCPLKHGSRPLPRALEEEAQQALAKRPRRVPPGPPGRRLHFPQAPRGRPGPARLDPPPPSPLPPGIAVPVVSPPAAAPFPTQGRGGGQDYDSRLSPRRRACALSGEVRGAVALRATAEAAERL